MDNLIKNERELIEWGWRFWSTSIAQITRKCVFWKCCPEKFIEPQMKAWFIENLEKI